MEINKRTLSPVDTVLFLLVCALPFIFFFYNARSGMLLPDSVLYIWTGKNILEGMPFVSLDMYSHSSNGLNPAFSYIPLLWPLIAGGIYMITGSIGWVNAASLFFFSLAAGALFMIIRHFTNRWLSFGGALIWAFSVNFFYVAIFGLTEGLSICLFLLGVLAMLKRDKLNPVFSQALLSALGIGMFLSRPVFLPLFMLMAFIIMRGERRRFLWPFISICVFAFIYEAAVYIADGRLYPYVLWGRPHIVFQDAQKAKGLLERVGLAFNRDVLRLAFSPMSSFSLLFLFAAPALVQGRPRDDSGFWVVCELGLAGWAYLPAVFVVRSVLVGHAIKFFEYDMYRYALIGNAFIMVASIFALGEKRLSRAYKGILYIVLFGVFSYSIFSTFSLQKRTIMDARIFNKQYAIFKSQLQWVERDSLILSDDAQLPWMELSRGRVVCFPPQTGIEGLRRYILFYKPDYILVEGEFRKVKYETG